VVGCGSLHGELCSPFPGNRRITQDSVGCAAFLARAIVSVLQQAYLVL